MYVANWCIVSHQLFIVLCEIIVLVWLPLVYGTFQINKYINVSAYVKEFKYLHVVFNIF